MEKGAFQISRTIFENDIWNDVVKFRLFFYILGNAVYSKDGITIAGIKLERGQFLRSLRNLQEDLSYQEGRGNARKTYPLSTIQRKIKSLVNEERMTVKSTEYGTLFTVLNYATYQGLSNYKKASVEQQRNSNGTATEQQRNNTNKDKKDKKDNNSRKRVYDENSLYYKMTDYFYRLILKNNPQHKKPNYQTWSDDFRKLVELDRRDKDQIRKVMEFVQSDDFEMKNVLSPNKLRQRYDQLFMKANQSKSNNFVKPKYEVVDGGKVDEKHSNESGHVRLFR